MAQIVIPRAFFPLQLPTFGDFQPSKCPRRTLRARLLPLATRFGMFGAMLGHMRTVKWVKNENKIGQNQSSISFFLDNGAGPVEVPDGVFLAYLKSNWAGVLPCTSQKALVTNLFGIKKRESKQGQNLQLCPWVTCGPRAHGFMPTLKQLWAILTSGTSQSQFKTGHFRA